MLPGSKRKYFDHTWYCCLNMHNFNKNSLFYGCFGSPSRETVQAMLEAERIAKDPTVKGYHDVDELFADLDS